MHSLVDMLPPISLWLAGAIAAAAVVMLLVMRRLFGPARTPARRRGLVVLRALVFVVLLAILANPVRVDESPGAVERAKVVYLLDASQSMALGGDRSRWEEGLDLIRRADELVPAQSQPERSIYRFGEGLAAVDGAGLGIGDWGLDRTQSPQSPISNPQSPIPSSVPGPTDADTQLAGALRGLVGRFGRSPPRAVVLFSDGQAREQPLVEEIARRYAALDVPIHTVPLGAADRHGDVAIVGLVAPVRVRKYSQQSVQVSVRSYGYDGRRTELTLSALPRDGQGVQRLLARLPITLTSGLQSFELPFQSGETPMRIQASIPPQPNEVSTANNTQTADVDVDRTKIRVLYLEGGDGGLEFRQRARYQVGGTSPNQTLRPNAADNVLSSPSYLPSAGQLPLPVALAEDPDIECNTLLVSGGAMRLMGSSATGAVPTTPAQLFAYDVLLVSDTPQSALEDSGLAWIDQWVADRGGGICMIGGPQSFAAGGWRGSPLEKMLPVALDAAAQDWEGGRSLVVFPAARQLAHPVWSIVSDEAANRRILADLPEFRGATRLGPAKPASTVLAVIGKGSGLGEWGLERAGPRQSPVPNPQPLIPVLLAGSYGKGRTMAMAVGLSSSWAAEWGATDQRSVPDNRYFAKFWRNVVYWLSENSSSGRRRLIATSDKIVYRPGETILLEAAAYDEAARETTECKVTLAVEPRSSSADTRSEYSPLRWPRELKRSGSDQGPHIAWSEELEMPRRAGRKGYALKLPITESASLVSQAPMIRLELSAFEGATLVDSTSLDIQVLDDPPELQNPLPNPRLLAAVAAASGGKVLTDADALSAMIRRLPNRVGPPRIEKTPLWSTAWLWGFLMATLTVEWLWRRRSGLA